MLDLELPLHAICGAYVEGDERANAVTATHVLTHTSGLPNIVGPQTPLKTYFAPGERFNCLAHFAWLQRAIERLTGCSLEELARSVFSKPSECPTPACTGGIGSDLITHKAAKWTANPLPSAAHIAAAASWSLVTTATNYARFVQVVLCGHGLSSEMHARWFTPAVLAREVLMMS